MIMSHMTQETITYTCSRCGSINIKGIIQAVNNFGSIFHATIPIVGLSVMLGILILKIGPLVRIRLLAKRQAKRLMLNVGTVVYGSALGAFFVRLYLFPNQMNTIIAWPYGLSLTIIWTLYHLLLNHYQIFMEWSLVPHRLASENHHCLP